MNVFDIFAKITLDTTEYDKNLDTAKSKGNSFGKSLTNGFKTAAELGAKAIAGATASLIAFGGASVRTGMNFDSSMSQVAATLGKTTKEMESDVQSVDLSWGKFTGNLREYAQEMGANTVFSATQAADALNYMALAGYDTEKSMNMLPNVLNLAAAGAMDLASASDMVTDTQTALGISMDRTGALIDEMARTASKTNTSVSQLGSAILTIGGTAKQLKGGFVEMADGTERAYDGTTELSAALGILADNGTKGSAAGTTLRNILSSLSSKKFETFKELGVQAYDAEGNMRSLKDILADMNDAMDGMTEESKTKLINSVFNARDLKSVNALLATTGDRWDEITLALLDSKGAAEAMAETQLDNLSGDITLFKSALEGAQIALSDKLTPSLRGFVKDGSEGLSEFTKKLKAGDMAGAIGEIGLALGKIAAEAVKRLPDMINAGITLIGGIITGMSTALSSGFSQIDLTSVVLPLIVGLSGKIRENANKLVETGVELINGIGRGIEGGIDWLAIPVETVLKNLAGIITDNGPLLFDAVTDLIERLGVNIGDGIPGFLENTALPMLLQFSESLRENAGVLVNTGIEFILNIAQGIMDSLPTLLEQLPQIIINVAGVINDNMPKIFAMGITLIKMLIAGIINAVPALIENFPQIFQAIIAVWSALNWIDMGKNVITWIKNGINNLFTTVPNALKDVGSKAIEFFKGVDWANAGTQAINFIKSAINGMFTAIPSTLKAVGESAVTAFKGINWFDLGANIIRGVVQGISSNVGAIVDAAKDAARSAFEAAKNFLGIKSPSRLFRYQVGEQISKGLALGIEDATPEAVESSESLAKKTLLPFDNVEIPTVETQPRNPNGGADVYSMLAAILAFLRENWPDDKPKPVFFADGGGGMVAYYDRQLGLATSMRNRGVT